MPKSKPSSGVGKRKKGNPKIFYVVATMEEVTESNEAMREVKKNTTTTRVVKPQSPGGSQIGKKSRVDVDPSGITLNKVKEAIA